MPNARPERLPAIIYPNSEQVSVAVAHDVARLITLSHITRTDAANDFYGEENMPRRAITMGVGTILEAHKIVLLARSEGKAAVVKHFQKRSKTLLLT